MSTKWNRMTARIMAALLALLLVAEGALPSFAGEFSPEGAGSDTYESEGSVLSEETESFEEGTDTDPERTDEEEDLPGSPENEDPDEDINDPDINITGDDPTEDAGLIREEEADPGKEFGIYEDDGDDFIHAENEIIEETMTEITEDHAESLKDGEVASGNCGLKDEANSFHEEDVVWSVTDLGEAGYQLTIELAEGVDTSVKYTTCENSSYGSPWSFYNQKIKKLVIGDGIKKIGKYSFYSMQNLTEVTFGTDVTEFGNNLFQDCKSLQTITLPAGLTTVGSCIFEGCTGLTSITIPESLTGISNGMFSGCSKLATVNMHDGITSIGETAFISCSALTSVTLPSGLETIGKQAFQSSGLTSVTIPAGVTTLPEKAFYYCGSLASVAFGVDEEENYGIETIGDYTFSNCSLLSSITLPSSVTTLRSYAFAYNGKLTEVNLNEGLLTIGEGAFKSFKAASLTIPSTVTTLNNYAFSSNSLLTEITFAKNAEEKCALTKIGQYAFADATKLTEITLPASVTNIEYPNILNGCSLLAHIYVEDGNTVYRNRKDAQNVKDGVVYKIDGDTESLYIRPPAFTGCIMPSEGTVTLTKDYFNGTDVTEVVLPASIKTIDSNAFDGCTKLASITFAEGTVLETIGSYAFRGCTALEAIDLPPSLKTINSSAFEGCSRLAAVTFETDEEEHLSLTTLGSYAFYKCSSLGSITLPGTITRMDGNVFQACTSLASVNFGEGWSLTIINGNTFKGCTSLTGITIPDSVTEIKDNAFDGCTGITSLNIPGTVTKINGSAFKGCSGITTLTLNDGLTEIGYYAFEDCTGITSLTVPKTVTKILGAAFKGNTSLATLTFAKGDDGTCALTDITGGQSFGGTALTTVTIPISIVNLTDSTFQNCAELRAVNIEEGDPANPKYYSIAGIVYLVSNNTPFIKPAKADLSQMVIQEDPEGILRKDYYKGNTSITEVTIPAWVTKIEAEAFKGCTALKKVKYADGCKLAAIGANAFENCTSLASFTCPSTIKETGIGSYAFKGCTSLDSVTLSKNMTKIASYLFQNCSSLTSVKIPAGVTQIMSYAFSGCTSLASVTFEGTSALTEIQWDAFENTALKSITLPKSLTALDRSAFYNSASLENINIESGNTVYYSESGIVYKKADGSVYITPPKNQHKDDTKTEFTSADVPANATTVTIPKNIRVIKSGAFKNNSKVKTVKFAKGSKLTTIEEQAFCRASSLTTIKLPSGLKTIGYRAFYDCDAIKSIKIPATVTSIGTEAFSSCAKLSSATINCPNTGNKTFYSCGKLATVKLGSGVKTIGDSCFYNDSSLKKLTLNKGLTSIGETAFYCCTSLKSVSIPATVTSAGIGTFNSCTNLASATIPGSLTSIPNSMFYGCRSLKKATIQKGVTTIGPSAFSTTLLPSVSLPDTVNFIGNNAFKDCMVLKSIRIPDKVTFIGTSVFEGCASLEKFSWPASITSIPSGTFRYCSRLSEIVLPEGTASISDYAFEGCTSLKILNVPSTVSSIDVLAFKLDSALEEINVADGNATYLSVDGILYRRTAAGKEFVYCPLAWNSSDTLTPPDGLSSIPAKAYYGNKTIVHLVIPATVTSIGESAFENCTSLRTVTFEAGCRLTSLPASAFSGCIDLNTVSFLGDTSVTSFGNYAFYQCADLTEIRFENNSTDIAVGKECFYQDYAFTGIFEGKELASLGDIGYGTFYQCRSIRDLRIGASCETIGTTRSEDADADVFAGCENLRSFTADDGGIFSAADGVLFREDWDDGEFSVTGPTLFKYPFQKADEEYTIPEGTVAVANYAFANCKEIVSVTPSEELEIIYKRGFYQSSVEEFDFETAGSSLRVIDVAAFRGCSSLKKAELGESSIRVLQGSAFRNCSRMQEVILPEDQMTAIGSYAFYGCSAMKHMNLDDTVTTIGDYAFNSCGSWLDVRIPQGLTGSIPKYAYAYCYKLKTLEFPAGVTSLGDYAFYYCSGLETVTIPATLKSIGERCFYDCYGMTELTFADRSEGENLYIDDWAFRYCSKLTQVKLPEKLTSIGSEVFGDCSELKRVELPSTLASVANNTYITINDSKIYGSYMFLNDSKLRQLIVRNPALNLKDNAFYSTNSSSGTQTVYVYSSKYEDPEAADPIETVIYRYCGNKSSGKYALTFVELEDLDDETADPGYENPDPVNPDDPSSYPKSGVVKAADNAEICWAYDEITKTVTISGTGAMPDRSTGWVNVDGVLTNMEAQTIPWKYYYGKVAEHLTIGEGITGIGSYCFNNMTALKDVSLPSTLASIGNYAFYCCSSLTSLVMPAGLRSIGSDAFCGCTLLTSFTMNEGLETVAYDAFYQTRITELHLPSTLTAISPDALNYCFLTESEGGDYISALETVTVAEGNRYYRVEDNVLYRIENGKETQIWGRLVRKMEIDGEETDVLYIPASYQIAYEDSNLDRSYRYAKVTCIIVDEDNPVYSTDEDHTALYSKDGNILYMVPYDYEGEFTVREGTRIIGENAMRSRSGITKVSFPDSVTEIRDSAMYYCTSLREVKFSASLWKIGYQAFYNCSSLRKVTLPEGIAEIGDSAFSTCYALRSVNLPATLTSLGNYAFAYCDELRSIEIPGSIGTIREDCFYSDDSLDDIRIGEGITEIGEWAFGYCTSLERITLPESLRSIRNNAFSYCSSLARVEIPASVDDIYYSTSTSGSTNYYYSPFECCAYELTFYGERGCYAQSWVENNDIKYQSGTSLYIHNASFVTGVPAKYLITYVLDPDEGEQNHIANPASFRAEGEVITIYPATKEASTEAPDGYEFGGWYTDKELTERVEKIIPSADRHSFTLYPEWLRNNRVSIETEEGGVIVLVPNGRSLSDVGYQPVSEDGKRSAGLVFADNEDLAFSLNAPVYEDLQLKAVFVSADEALTKAPFSSVESGEVPVGIVLSLTSDTPDAHIYYTINGDEPLDAEGEAAEDALRYKDRILLTEDVFDGGDTVTLKAMAVKKGAVSAMSVYEYRLMDEDGYWGSVLPMDRSEYAEAEKTAGGLWIAGLRESYPYTGAAVKPGIRVYDGKALLKEGKDYTVSFKNNVNATPENAPESKLPQLTVTGKNNYKDSMKATFRIGQKSVSSLSYTAKCYLTWTETIDGSYYYFEEPVFVKLNPGKKAQKPVPALNDNGKALKAGKDFTVRYYTAVFKKENDRLPEMEDDITTNWGRYTPVAAPKDPGIYCAAVTGKGNYTGTRYYRFHIEKDLIPISKAQITGFVKSYEYDDGDAIYQNKMVLKRGKDTLVSGTDYSLSYSNNREVGTATLIIYGRGKYTGMVKKTYKITGLPFKKAKLYEFQKSLSYTGKPLFQTAAFFTYPVKTDTGIAYVDLVEGADYKVSYSRNIEKGKATVTYTGLGLLYGSVKKTFTIKGLDINKASKQKRPTVKAVIEGGNNVPYAKGGVKPAVSVTFREQPLAEGRDYTVKYRNNLKLAEASGKNTDPAVIITGKGNFAGSITIPFSIVESDIGSLSINASDVVYGTRENAAAAKVKITDTTGKALIAGTDYEKAFEYAFEEPGSVVNAQGTPAGNKAAGDAFDPSTEYPAAGSVIRVTVTGKGNYRETISAVYRVTTADISKAVIKLKAGKTFTYTGSGIVPSKEDLSVKVGGKELTDTDYEIISVTNNLSKGKAILTIRGTGPNYGGIKTQTFAINAKSMK
ncbi:MAG: leucine-rich repeat protein [Lachnospiraceae bacterium]|nr:leucine-rich repeat protein [Lachnospiraceae bacterium]